MTYDFWLTASTQIGEGEKTRLVRVPPNNKIPARIISFSRSLETPWKREIVLPCESFVFEFDLFTSKLNLF